MVERRKRDGSVESRSVPRGKFQSWGGRYTGLSKIGTSECLTRVADTGVERETKHENSKRKIGHVRLEKRTGALVNK